MRLGSTRWRLPFQPDAMALTPDGKTLATTYGDARHVTLWDVASGAVVRTLRIAPVPKDKSFTNIAMAISPDGKWLAATCHSALRVWDLERGTEHILGPCMDYASVFFSPDSRRLASFHGVMPLTLYDTSNFSRCRVIENTDRCLGAAFSNDGEWIARVGGPHGKPSTYHIQIIACATGNEASSVHLEHAGPARPYHLSTTPVRFSPSGDALSVVLVDESIHTFDLPQGTARAPRPIAGLLTRGLHSLTQNVLFAPEHDTVVAYRWGPTVLFDVRTGKPRAQLPNSRSVALSPDGALLATDDGKHVRFWNPATGESLHAFEGHSDDVTQLQFSPDGATLFTGDGATHASWDCATGAQHWQRPAESDPRWNTSPDGRLAWRQEELYGYAGWMRVEVFDVATGERVCALAGKSAGIPQFSPDGATLYAPLANALGVWSARTGEALGEIGTLPHAPHPFAVSRDGRRVVLTCQVAPSQVWSLEGTPARVCELQGRVRVGRVGAMSPDGALFAVSCADHHVRVWELETGVLRATLEGHTRDLDAMAFSPDGARLATADARSLRLWDTARGEELSVQKVGASALQFSPDGALLASGHVGSALLWDVHALLSG